LVFLPIPNKIQVFKRDLVFIHKHKVNCGLERFLKGLNVNKDSKPSSTGDVMSDEKVIGTVKDIKVGKYMIIDGVPCRVVSIDVSAPGKHGHAKVRITGIGIFNGEKKVFLGTSHATVEIPIITRTTAQIVSVSGDSVQLMDTNTYEVYELPITDDIEGTPEPGKEAEIIEALGKRKIIKIKG